MEYKNGFAKDEFLQYMFNEFFNVYNNQHAQELLSNVIDYFTRDNFTHSKNTLFYTLEKIIPEISNIELLSFFDKSIITNEVIEYCWNEGGDLERNENSNNNSMNGIQQEFNEFGIKEIQADNLPKGWVWQQYDDGSGHLKSPEGANYFSYDWTTGEYKIKREDKHYDFFLDENYSTGGYSIGSFSEFKSYAENWINNNVLKIERMDKIPPPSEPTIVADYTNIPNINEDNVIMRYPNGKYYNHYGYDIETGNSSSIAGGFNTLTEATKMMYKHRYTSAQKTSIRDLLENKKSQQNSLSNENLTQSVKENQILK